jgi:hypothetical protein
VSALQKTPRYGYYPDPKNESVVEYGPYDTAQHYAPYATTNPRTGSARNPNPGGPGDMDAPGREHEPGEGYGRDFDPSLGGALGGDKGNNPDAPAGDPGSGSASMQQTRRRPRGRTAPRAGTSLLVR